MTAGLPVGVSAWPRLPVNLLLAVLLAVFATQAMARGTRGRQSTATSDRAKPDISIVAPTSASTFSTSVGLLTLAGVASDDVGVTRVTWTNSRGGKGTATGTSNWSIGNISLRTGTNKISVSAYDARGQSRTAQLSVDYSATAPVPIPTPVPIAIPDPDPEPVLTPVPDPTPVLVTVPAPAPEPEPEPPVNHPPVISGTPATSVQSSAAYSFTPVASDQDGNPLSFSVMGAPAWTSLNGTTGQLSGTPGPDDVGATEGIVITVSDGIDYASLPAFTLVVKPNTSGTALVSWLPPTQRTDGSPLGNLAGYRVYYGKQADALTETVDVNNSGLSSYMVEGLGTGTWYFAVAACDTAGKVSELSNVGSKTIR